MKYFQFQRFKYNKHAARTLVKRFVACINVRHAERAKLKYPFFPLCLVTLSSLGGEEFLGFTVQAREAGTSNLIGSFTLLDSSNSQTLGCSGNSEATVSIALCPYVVIITWESAMLGIVCSSCVFCS